MTNVPMHSSQYEQDEGSPASSSVFLSYVGILRRRIWVVMPITVIFATLGLIQALRAPEVYKASTQLELEKQRSGLPFDREDGSWDPDFYPTQRQLITRRPVIQLALLNERLNDMFAPGESAAAPASFAGEISQTIRAVLGMAPPPTREPWEKLQKKLNVYHVDDTSFLTVEAKDADGARAALIANEVAKAFKTYHQERHKNELGEQFKMLSSQMEEQKVELFTAERELQKFRRNAKNVTPSSTSSTQPTEDRLFRLSDKLTEVQLQRIELKSQLAVMDEAMNAQDLGSHTVDKRLFAIPIIQTDQELGSIRQELSDAEKSYVILLETYGRQHPVLREAETNVFLLRNQFKEGLEELTRAHENQLKMLVNEEETLLASYAEQKQVALETSKEHFEYTLLLNKVDRHRTLYDGLVDRMSEVDINSGLSMLSVHIEEARIPTHPVPTHKLRKIIFAIILGMFLGGGLAFLFENLDDTIKTPEDLTDRLDVPLLGFVPSMDQGDADAAEAKGGFRSAYGDVFRSLRDRFPALVRQVAPTPEILDAKEPTAEERQRRGRFVLTDPTSSIAEAYRSIRASLLYSMPADAARLLAVTSCRPREGKTTTCTNLALSISQTGKKVLLIDGDLHRPTINKTLAMTAEAGLTSVLVGETTWVRAVRQVHLDGEEVENLDVITAGPASPNPSELLGSEKMKELLAEVKEAYDLVLIDTAPVLFVSDASILSVMCDGVILIVKSGDSTRSLLLRAVERLTAVRARILGSILNNVIVSRVGRYYSTYYHVGYSRYAKDYGKTYYSTSREPGDEESASDTPAVDSKIKVSAKEVAASDSDVGDVNRLQQDLNVERVMRSRAEKKAAQQERELKARIATLERTIEKDDTDPNSPKTDTALTDWVKRKQRDADGHQKEVSSKANEETVAHVGPNGSPSSSPPRPNGKASFVNPIGDSDQQTSDDPHDLHEQHFNNIETEMKLHQAISNLNSGDYHSARVVLQELVDASPELIQAWERFIEVLALSNDCAALTECVSRLCELGPSHRHLHDAACGQLAIVQNDFDTARNHLENADSSTPKNDFVMESLVRVDFRQNRIEDARERTQTLLMSNPDSAYAHYVTAYLHILDGRQVDAERSLTRSLALRKTSEALHDLAWILSERGAHAEAEEAVHQAIAIDESIHSLWDTLGTIQMQTQKYDEAEISFERSLALNQNNVQALLNMAEVLVRQGNRPRAREMDALLSNLRDALSPEDLERLGTIRAMAMLS